MKQKLANLVQQSIASLADHLEGVNADTLEILIEKTRDERFGDYASNIALVLAGQANCKPRELAEKIVAHLPPASFIRKIEIAGPGFINFTITPDAQLQIIPDILNQQGTFGRSDYGSGDSVLVEFVSANPTGPLHIGHGRGAAYGAATANLLEATGYRVEREYYVNDSGRQMDILTASIYLRYLHECGNKIPMPEQSYRGEYIKMIAEEIHTDRGDSLVIDTSLITGGLSTVTDEEAKLDLLISLLKEELGEPDYDYVFNCGKKGILDDIRSDLEEFGISFDTWFSEKELLASGKVKKAIDTLQQQGHLYKKDGATWFKSTAFGDEKDRVVIRENGQLTYFATDIAYHLSKYERGFNQVIDVWGADHHGYIARVKAAVSALGQDVNTLEILLVQFATLYRGDVKIQMSTRSGQFVTLRELRDEVGTDATRFFYVMRKSEQHLDFDLELAKSQSQDNPVYYIQYAHARICSIFSQLRDRGDEFSPVIDLQSLNQLVESYEQNLINRLTAYPESVQSATIDRAPHQLCYFLRDLANEFHTYYNACQILVQEKPLRDARLTLLCAIRQVIQNGLEILGVSAPESM